MLDTKILILMIGMNSIWFFVSRTGEVQKHGHRRCAELPGFGGFPKVKPSTRRGVTGMLGKGNHARMLFLQPEYVFIYIYIYVYIYILCIYIYILYISVYMHLHNMNVLSVLNVYIICKYVSTAT